MLSDILSALKDLWELVSTWFVSMLEGLAVMGESLLFVSDMSGSAAVWMPSALFGIMVNAFALIVVLRIIGR